MAAGAVLAVAASVGLGWWLSVDVDPRAPPPAPAGPPSVAGTTPRQPPPVPDRAQVQRAYEQYQSVYAEEGRPGLVGFSRSCAQALAADPRILDYCLAFDLYADDAPGRVEAEAAHNAEARRLAVARHALAGDAQAAAARIVDVRRLMRQVVQLDSEPVQAGPPRATPVAGEPARSPSPPAKVRATASSPPPPALVPARPAPPRRRPASQAPPAPPAGVPISPRRLPPAPTAGPCRPQGAPADRLVCGDPELLEADRRLHLAYERALAAGADPLRIDQEQARWRIMRDSVAERPQAMARVYERRIADLNALADDMQGARLRSW